VENGFNKDDKKRIIEFLNLMAEKANFDGLKVADIIKIHNALAYMQTNLLPKIDANILEVIQVIEPEKKPARKTPAKGKK